MKNHLTILLSLFLLFSFSDSRAQHDGSDYDALLTELFPADGPGGTALIAQDGKVIYRKAFGLANVELNVPMKPAHIFRIGSITKQFTASAILKLAEEGKLSLQDDITKFIPDYPTNGHTITVEHLLTHTSGIKSYTGMEKWTTETRKKDFTPVEMVDYFKDEPMDFAPGEDFRYNNSGYFLLGYIIEIVSGTTYEDYIDQSFFKPLNMKDSYYGNPYRIIRNRAAGYEERDGELRNAQFLSMTQPYSAGSLLSTVDDVYTWYRAVMSGRVISEKSLEKAHRSYKLLNGKSTGYGYGWAIGNIQGHPMIQHGGGINGYLTASLYLPEEKLFVGVFSNCNCHYPGEVAEKLAAIAIGKPFAWEKIDLPAEKLKGYEAVYESDHDGRRIVSFEDGQLYSQRSGGNKFRIFPFEEDKFYFEEGLTVLEFQRDPSGKLTGVISRATGEPVLWKHTDKPIPKMEVIEMDEKTLDRYTGNYQLAPEFIITISREGSKMYAVATGQDRIEIFPYEPDRFFATSPDIRLWFNPDDKGKIESLTLVQNGEHKAAKID